MNDEGPEQTVIAEPDPLAADGVILPELRPPSEPEQHAAGELLVKVDVCGVCGTPFVAIDVGNRRIDLCPMCQPAQA